MPLHELPGEIKRNKLIKALKRLDFIIDKKGGDSSHYKIICPKNEKSITLPQKIHKHTLNYILKEIKEYSGVTWEEIQKKL